MPKELLRETRSSTAHFRSTWQDICILLLMRHKEDPTRCEVTKKKNEPVNMAIYIHKLCCASQCPAGGSGSTIEHRGTLLRFAVEFSQLSSEINLWYIYRYYESCDVILKLHAAIPFVRENSWKCVGTFIPYRLTACWNKTKIRGSVLGVGDAKVTYFNMGVYGEHCKNCTFCFVAQNCAINLNRKT